LLSIIRRLAIGGLAAVSLPLGLATSASAVATSAPPASHTAPLMATRPLIVKPTIKNLPASGSVIEIQNVYSGLCLNDYGFSTTAGNDMVQWNCNPGNANQNWELNYIGGGLYTLVNEYSHMCLDDYGYSTADGNAMVQWPCHAGSQNQEWSIDVINGAGFYFQNDYSGLYLVDYGYSTAEGNIIRQYHYDNGGHDELWNIGVIS
jgi:hypothetical protein